jgi:type II secretory pathway pseudopilin PulG
VRTLIAGIPGRARARRGLTLVETVVSAAVAALLFSAVGVAVVRANRTFKAAEAVGETERLAERSLQRIAREFRDVVREDVTASAALDSIQYRRIEAIDGETVTKTPLRRVRLEIDPNDPDDGVDNDRDGRVDERRVVLSTDTSVAGGVVLVENVRELLEGELANGLDDNGNGLIDEPGFCATYDVASGVVTLRLTIERTAPEGAAVTRTTETAMRLRNAGL